MHQGDKAGIQAPQILVLQVNSLNDHQGIDLQVLAHHFGRASARIEVRRSRHPVPVQLIQVG